MTSNGVYRYRADWNPPQYLYKYRDWSIPNHCRAITEREFYFTSPERFNDPFDCRIPFRYDLEPQDTQFERALRVVAKRNPKMLRDEQVSAAVSRVKEMRMATKDELRDQFRRMDAYTFTRFGVYCLTAVHDDILMWSHYANGHQGLCMGFDTVSMDQWLENLVVKRNIDVFPFQVRYDIDYPELMPNDDSDPGPLTERLTVKSERWEYEQEYRLILFSKHDLADNERLLHYRPEILRCVYLGCRMSTKAREEILGVIEKRFPDCTVWQSIEREGSFALDFEKVNS